jgi:hypothetical protein
LDTLVSGSNISFISSSWEREPEPDTPVIINNDKAFLAI